MIEPPKLYTSARRDYDVLDIEILGQFTIELGLHTRHDIRQCFERLLETAGTHRFPEEFRLIYDYVMQRRACARWTPASQEMLMIFGGGSSAGSAGSGGSGDNTGDTGGAGHAERTVPEMAGSVEAALDQVFQQRAQSLRLKSFLADGGRSTCNMARMSSSAELVDYASSSHPGGDAHRVDLGAPGSDSLQRAEAFSALRQHSWHAALSAASSGRHSSKQPGTESTPEGSNNGVRGSDARQQHATSTTTTTQYHANIIRPAVRWVQQQQPHKSQQQQLPSMPGASNPRSASSRPLSASSSCASLSGAASNSSLTSGPSDRLATGSSLMRTRPLFTPYRSASTLSTALDRHSSPAAHSGRAHGGTTLHHKSLVTRPVKRMRLVNSPATSRYSSPNTTSRTHGTPPTAMSRAMHRDATAHPDSTAPSSTFFFSSSEEHATAESEEAAMVEALKKVAMTVDTAASTSAVYAAASPLTPPHTDDDWLLYDVDAAAAN